MNEPQPGAGTRRVRLETLRLRVGERLQLIVDADGRQLSCFSTLIGCSDGEFVIVRAPADGAFAARAQAGVPLKLRLFTGTQIVEFDAQLQRPFGPPLSYWHLSYPPQVRATTLRGAARVSVDLPARVQRAAGQAVDARIVDLSLRGLQLVCSELLGQPDERVDVQFELPRAGEAPVAVRNAARIRSVRPAQAAAEAAASNSHGLQFVELSPAEQLALQTYVLEKLGLLAGADGE